MNMIFVLIGCSIALAIVFLAAFFWAVRSGQHNDTYTPGVRILFDDEVLDPEPEKGDQDHF